MQKTKLGISVGLLGAIMCFSAFFGSYMIALVLLGYILLFESNEWLKKNSVKVVVIMIAFSVANCVIGLIPDAISLIDSIFAIINRNFSISIISKIVNICLKALDILKTLLFLLLGFKAFNQGTVPISFIDNIIDKHFSKDNQ